MTNLYSLGTGGVTGLVAPVSPGPPNKGVTVVERGGVGAGAGNYIPGHTQTAVDQVGMAQTTDTGSKPAAASAAEGNLKRLPLPHQDPGLNTQGDKSQVHTPDKKKKSSS